ncbi:MAG: hypothetical protein R6X33_06520 [Candidatus Brocadiia bacterium]
MRKHSVQVVVLIVAAAFAGGFVAQALFGSLAQADAAQTAQVMKAKSFVVVDDEGREHLALGPHSQGMGLVVRDGELKDRMVLGLLPEDQVGLVMNNAEGMTQVALGAWESTNHLDLYDGERRPRFTVGVSRDAGNAGLAFYDPQKAQRLGIGMGPGGGGDFVMSNAQGWDIWRASWNRHEPGAEYP